jgi:hypothetical protein
VLLGQSDSAGIRIPGSREIFLWLHEGSPSLEYERSPEHCGHRPISHPHIGAGLPQTCHLPYSLC